MCGKIEKLSDWNKIGVVVDMDPSDKKAKRQKGKKTKRQKDKKAKRQKKKKASHQKTHAPPRRFLYLRETKSWRWLEGEKGEEGGEAGKKSV